MVAGLLFLAFAFFAVGQAAVNRNGAQTAADAAALAAAQETRDQLAERWESSVLDPTKWQDIFDGVDTDSMCSRAEHLAALNDAGVVQCKPGVLDYEVTVQSNRSAGDSVIPSTSTTRAHASATAVIEPLCDFDPPGQGPPDDVLPSLICDEGKEWTLDPKDLSVLPGPEDLFDVHLAD